MCWICSPLALRCLLVLLFIGLCANAAAPSDSLMREDGMLFYRVAGDGMPVLLLTGGPGFSGDYLEPVFARLSSSMRAVLPDQPGTGRSHLQQADSATLTMARIIDDLEALRAKLGVSRWAVLGHAFGGLLAMVYAANHPERVSGLALVCPGGLDPGHRRSAAVTVQSRLAPMDKEYIRYWSDSSRWASDPTRATIEILKIRARGYMYDRANTPAVASRISAATYSSRAYRALMQDAQVHQDVRAAMTYFDSPVLIIAGAADPMEPDVFDTLHRTFMNSSLYIVPKAGHFPWVENPDGFYEVMEAFLRSVPATEGVQAGGTAQPR